MVGYHPLLLLLSVHTIFVPQTFTNAASVMVGCLHPLISSMSMPAFEIHKRGVRDGGLVALTHMHLLLQIRVTV